MTPELQPAKGLLLGLLAIVCFSLTLPATRLAVESFDPVFVGLGRAVVAACVALPLLLLTKQPRPRGRQFRRLATVVVGVVIGFPLLSAWAMKRVPASHGAIVLGILPLATAIAGCLSGRERPSAAFWIAGVAGSLTVVLYAHSVGGGSFHPADGALLGSVILAAIGYTGGASLSRELGGWQVICWALVAAAPVLLLPVALEIHRHGMHGTPAAWAGFAYVSLFSALLGFFAWYRGLVLGGIARVSQVQLLQPFFTMGFAALLLHEPFRRDAAVAAAIVSLSILVSRKSRIRHQPGPPSVPAPQPRP